MAIAIVLYDSVGILNFEGMRDREMGMYLGGQEHEQAFWK